MQGRFAVALGLVAVVSTACTITVTKDANGPSTHAAAPSVSAASPTPSDVSAVKPKQPNSAARVEGKFRGGGLFTDTVTMVPRCRGGGECDVVANSPKGGYKFDYKQGAYSAEHTFDETCGSGGHSTGLEINVQYKFRIARAKYIHDEWRATALKVVERINSPGASQTFTTSTSVGTLTCDGYHKKNRGTMVLAGNY